ncbi:hypothetical protein BJX99DRAFT_255376 [Aspergillus californicus]
MSDYDRSLEPKWYSPYIVEPRCSIQQGQGAKPPTHTHTMILLHGMQCTVKEFAETYLKQSGQGDELPAVKFVFPSRERIDKTYGRVLDRWIGVGCDLDLGQLKDCCRYLKELIDTEAKILKNSGIVTSNHGYDRVVIGGYGDGASVALYSLLGGSATRRLAGYIGIDGGLPWPVSTSGLMKDMERNINLFRETLAYKLVNPKTWPEPDNDWALNTRCFRYLSTPIFLGKGAAGSQDAVGAVGYELHRILTMGFGLDVIYQEVYQVPSETMPRWAHTIAGLKSEMFNFLDGKARVGSTQSTDLTKFIPDDLCDSLSDISFGTPQIVHLDNPSNPIP